MPGHHMRGWGGGPAAMSHVLPEWGRRTCRTAGRNWRGGAPTAVHVCHRSVPPCRLYLLALLLSCEGVSCFVCWLFTQPSHSQSNRKDVGSLSCTPVHSLFFSTPVNAAQPSYRERRCFRSVGAGPCSKPVGPSPFDLFVFLCLALAETRTCYFGVCGCRLSMQRQTGREGHGGNTGTLGGALAEVVSWEIIVELNRGRGR